jgi:hypothetical protein
MIGVKTTTATETECVIKCAESSSCLSVGTTGVAPNLECQMYNETSRR